MNPYTTPKATGREPLPIIHRITISISILLTGLLTLIPLIGVVVAATEVYDYFGLTLLEKILLLANSHGIAFTVFCFSLIADFSFLFRPRWIPGACLVSWTAAALLGVIGVYRAGRFPAGLFGPALVLLVGFALFLYFTKSQAAKAWANRERHFA